MFRSIQRARGRSIITGCRPVPKESERVKRLYKRARGDLIRQSAYFSRPYAPWAPMVYNRDAQSTIALRKMKKIFDPGNIMNPGRLCF